MEKVCKSVCVHVQQKVGEAARQAGEGRRSTCVGTVVVGVTVAGQEGKCGRVGEKVGTVQNERVQGVGEREGAGCAGEGAVCAERIREV